MNIFIIPSWYPSESSPNEGVYYRNQVETFAKLYPQLNFGISLWGQGEYKYLIQKNDHLRNLVKLANRGSLKKSQRRLKENLYEFFTPAFTWTRKFLKGNIAAIVKANQLNIENFQNIFGKVDLIHAYVSHPGGYVAMILSETMNIPYIITEHMGPFPFKSYLNSDGSLSEFITRPLSKSSLNIAVSPVLAQTMKSYNVPKIRYLPNSVDEDFFYPRVPTIGNKTFTFLTCADVIYDKGIFQLIKAVELLKSKGLTANFKIAGKGKDLDGFKKMTKKLYLSEDIIFLGEIMRDKIMEEIQQCDAYILPSLHENMPISILEALACGKPVISTKCGGPEFMIREENGIIVEPGNVLDLSEGIQRIIENYSNYKTEVIRRLFLETYSSKKVFEETKFIYEGVVANNVI
jgi:glycosyltransferase involved in cell wall biosynthesis